MTDGFGSLTERIESLRGEHDDAPLRRAALAADPLIQFAAWLEDALEAHPGWPNAMTLATADAAGHPSARTVLLKGVDEHGFTFFTNHLSRKGRELDVNPHAALVFYWPGLERQVRASGPVVRLTTEESKDYFDTRPRMSRLGAWASAQSSEIASRKELEDRVAELDARFGDDIPLPDHWGGYRMTPVEVEFWKARSDRLHDRFVYRRAGETWQIARLAP